MNIKIWLQMVNILNVPVIICPKILTLYVSYSETSCGICIVYQLIAINSSALQRGRGIWQFQKYEKDLSMGPAVTCQKVPVME